MSKISESKDINITRVYDAPLQAVWDAWTDVEQVAQWWGPRGFTITTHSKDLRVGGHWNYTMHGPDGVDWPNSTKYLEVVPLAKLVYDHGGNETQPPLFRVTVLFSEVAGKTHMEMKMSMESLEKAAQIRQVIKHASGNSTWDRLGEYLVERLTDKQTFIINRSFEAPRELMFTMWSDPEHLKRWMGPTGVETQFIHADIRSGGSSMYSMSAPGFTMYGKAFYEEIRRPDRIVYTQQFCTQDGKVSRHPMAPLWPETMRTTVDFAEEGPDCTRVTITWEVVGPVKPEEMAVFIGGRAGMTQGWTGSFDKLEELLAADAAAKA